MKKHLSKKTIWKTLLSVVALGIFILAALGSLGLPYSQRTKILANGDYETSYYSTEDIETYIGKHDDMGKWHGPITIEILDKEGRDLGYDYCTEEVNYVHGLRHGVSKMSYSDGLISYKCYNMGKSVKCEKAAHSLAENTTAYELLSYKYPWYLFALNGLAFEEEHVESFMDTIEVILDSYTFETIDFDEYYGDALDELEETEYDSILTICSALSYFQGLEIEKNSEFRLAVVDHYRSDGNTTYEIISTRYPGYLFSMNEEGLSDEDFEVFCNDLDDTLASYGPLDLEDPFFIDSVDTRLFMAIISIYNTEEVSSSQAILALRNGNKDLRTIYQKINSLLEPSAFKSSSKEVSVEVLTDLLLAFDQGDIVKRAVKEAYLSNHGVLFVPVVTTENISSTAASTTIQGYVIEDGGAEVTSRGLVLADSYNPSLEKQSETSGAGTGAFSVTLSGLTEGLVYYARAYASNSEGIAYGNCISFTAGVPSGINPNNTAIKNFSVFPNPASSYTTFSFELESVENTSLSIVNMKGQVVYQKNSGNFVRGENSLRLKLSELTNGMYTCLLTTDGAVKESLKLLIRH